MELNEHIIQLFELYVNNKATEAQKQEVDSFVKANAEAATILKAMQLSKRVLIERKVSSAEKMFKALGQQRAKTPAKASNSWRKQLKQAGSYTLAQLEKLFAPHPIYKNHSSIFSLRTNQVSLAHPEEAFDCTNYELQFELKTPLSKNEEVDISVENNLGEEKFFEEYDSPQQTFTITLNPQIFTSGLYYWKFSVGDFLIIGSFFIDKHLNPYNLN